MNKLAKITLNGKPLGDCPVCKSEDSLYVSSVLKWGKIAKWQHIPMCSACKYEGKAK
jgi:hypothetical protein